MDLTIIAAYAGPKRVIGYNGEMPWHIPEDLKRFKKLTLGHPIIMGRTTYDSLPKKPLPERTNIVLTRNTPREHFHKDVHVYESLDDAIDFARSLDNEVFIIGGENVYRQALPLATKMEITEIAGDFNGDAFFPEFPLDEWEEVPKSRINLELFSFVTYRRRV